MSMGSFGPMSGCGVASRFRSVPRHRREARDVHGDHHDHGELDHGPADARGAGRSREPATGTEAAAPNKDATNNAKAKRTTFPIDTSLDAPCEWADAIGIRQSEQSRCNSGSSPGSLLGA